MKPAYGQLIYEGKAKKIFSSAVNEEVFVEFKDDATAFNALKHKEFKGKGILNCQISAHLFEILKRAGIPTHFIRLVGDSLMLSQRVDVIPLEIVIRNIATGSLCKQTPLVEGLELAPPLLDFYYKDDKLGDPLLTKDRIQKIGLVTSSQLAEISDLALSVNTLLKEFFLKLDLTLVDFKLEMGLNSKGLLLVADEISPDTCRIWDRKNPDINGKILDKDRFRKDLGGVMEAYGEILKRVQGITPKPTRNS